MLHVLPGHAALTTDVDKALLAVHAQQRAHMGVDIRSAVTGNRSEAAAAPLPKSLQVLCQRGNRLGRDSPPLGIEQITGGAIRRAVQVLVPPDARARTVTWSRDVARQTVEDRQERGDGRERPGRRGDECVADHSGLVDEE